MPKFLTYQRPAPVTKQNWNHAPDRKTKVPITVPEQQKPALPVFEVSMLEQLIRKE